MSLIAELKRRNVFRVGAAYVIVAWLLVEVASVVLPTFKAPEWVMQVFTFLVILGFPLALIFAWAFELTPEGIKRESAVDRAESITHVTGRKLDFIIIGLLAVALIFVVVDNYILEAGPEQASVVREKSIAVLPFVNISDDKQNEYFSDGISEELLNVLVRVEGLRVPSRTSSFTFKGSDMKLAEIGRELNVDNVLEGSVRKSGDRIRVTAQLIDVKTDTHLWSDTYTRELDDIFAVQDEIAQAIVAALKVTLTGDQEQHLTQRSTDSVEAYNKYLLGRHLWNSRSRKGLIDSVTPLREAVEIDPEFTDAWAALADAYVLIPEYSAGPMDQYIPLAREAVSRALALNQDSARALTTSGYIKYLYEYDLLGAREDFLKAIEIEPAYATAHHWYGEALSVERHIDEALEQFRIGAELDPLAPIMWHVAGWITRMAGQYEESLALYQKALEINPYFEVTHGNLAPVYAMLGQYDRAMAKASQYSEMSGEDTSVELKVFAAMENPSLKPAAMEALDGFTNLNGTMGKAQFYMWLDEPDLAMDTLETSFVEGDSYAIYANLMVVYDPLRDNPRFQAHLAKMNLWP
jgi:TolB-like protein